MAMVVVMAISPEEEAALLQEHFDSICYANDERPEDDFPATQVTEGEDD